jgi:RNA polymerase sigma-70 factor (ECF subfamily)
MPRQDTRVGLAWRRWIGSPWQFSAQQPTDSQAASQDTATVPTSAPARNADYERFIHDHERVILNYLWRITGDEETAYDLTQEVFLRAWQRFETVRTYDQPLSWLFRVATNLALTYLKRRSLSTRSHTQLDGVGDPATSDPAWHLAESDLVRDILLQLSPQRRAALVLREVYGLSGAEVGDILGISPSAVRMALHRAREQFRDLYLREGRRDHGA